MTNWLRDHAPVSEERQPAQGVSVDLTGRRVLVTGASSGIGAATCRSVVGCGGSVAMIARRNERLAELRTELGDRAVSVQCDVTDVDALEAAVGEAARALAGLDAVVAVAGQTMAGAIATGTPQRWRELLDLNLVAPLATARFALNHFPATGRRDIVLMGSAGSITPLPAAAIYGASKRGLHAAAESLRLELAPVGVNVSIVMPGMIDTEGLSLEGIVIDGEPPAFATEVPMFARHDTGPAPPAALADSIAFMIGLPDGICINELVVRPTTQLYP